MNVATALWDTGDYSDDDLSPLDRPSVMDTPPPRSGLQPSSSQASEPPARRSLALDRLARKRAQTRGAA